MSIIQWMRDIITAHSDAEKIKQEKDAEAKRCAKVLAEHYAFWLFEYPMRMAEVSAHMALMNARADKMKADAQLKAAEDNAAWQAKLCAIYTKANTSTNSK